MDKVAFHNWLKKPEEITANDQRFLQEAAQRYPYAAVIQMLYLKSLQADKNYLFQPQLKRTSFLHGDRKLLYGFLQTDSIDGQHNQEDANSLQQQVALQQKTATKTATSTVENRNTSTTADKEHPIISGAHQNQSVEEIKATSENETSANDAPYLSVERPKELIESVSSREAVDPPKAISNTFKSEGEIAPGKEKTDKDVAPVAGGKSATTISPTGEVSIDLDRLDPRTRAVIERSLALHKKIKEDKADDEKSAPPERFDEHDDTPKVETAVEGKKSLLEPLQDAKPEEAAIEKEQEIAAVAANEVKESSSKQETTSLERSEEETEKKETEEVAVAANEVEESSLEPETTQKARTEKEIEKKERDKIAVSNSGFDIEEVNAKTQVPNLANTSPDKETAKSTSKRVESIEVRADKALDEEGSLSLYGKTALLEFSADEIEHPDTDQEYQELATISDDFSKARETSARKEEEKSLSSEPHSFEEWLQLANSGLELQRTTAPVVEKIKLIDAFIEKVPELKPKKEDFNKKGLNVAALTLRGEESFMTETLANIYVQQKHFDKAIGAFEILALKYPEKSSFFADRIEEVTKLKNFNK